MTAPLFLVSGQQIQSDVISLDGAEGRHASVVKRLRAGESVDLADGAGHVAHCVVSETSRFGLVCQVEGRYDVPQAAPRLVVVQALPKGDRASQAVEMLTEIGADVIVPWAAERCVAQWSGDRADKALSRWQVTAREAVKQSRRAWLPAVASLASTGDVVALLRSAALGVVLHETGGVPLSDVDVPDSGDVVIVVGPEGGLTDDELAAFGAAGAHVARLGPTVLRTSTAGVVAGGALLSRTSRWR